MRGFRLENGVEVWHRLVLRDGLMVREGFGPDLSLMKEWSATYKKVERYLDGSIILDIGANLGIFSRMALTRFGAEKCFCYEPDPGAFSVLRHNVRKGNLFQSAVGECSGTTELNISPSGNSISASTVFNKRGRQSLKVDQVSFTKIVEKHSPTLIKSDCEGAELYWLNGQTLPEFVKVVTAELHREEPGFEQLSEKVIRSFRRGWKEIHPPRSYSFHRCWIVSWVRI